MFYGEPIATPDLMFCVELIVFSGRAGKREMPWDSLDGMESWLQSEAVEGEFWLERDRNETLWVAPPAYGHFGP